MEKAILLWMTFKIPQTQSKIKKFLFLIPYQKKKLSLLMIPNPIYFFILAYTLLGMLLENGN